MTKASIACLALLLLGSTLTVEVSAAGTGIPKTVGRDQAGDWTASPSSEVGTASGQDLLRASISRSDDNTIEFILDVSQIPPAPPQTAFAVYEWWFTVDGERFAFYGPCQGHIYGDCATATDPLSFVVSGPDGHLMGVARLDDYEDVGQIIFPVPMSFLGAESGSIIAPSSTANHASDSAVIAHTFYFVNNPLDGSDGSPRDYLTVKKKYRVP